MRRNYIIEKETRVSDRDAVFALSVGKNVKQRKAMNPLPTPGWSSMPLKKSGLVKAEVEPNALKTSIMKGKRSLKV